MDSPSSAADVNTPGTVGHGEEHRGAHAPAGLISSVLMMKKKARSKSMSPSASIPSSWKRSLTRNKEKPKSGTVREHPLADSTVASSESESDPDLKLPLSLVVNGGEGNTTTESPSSTSSSFSDSTPLKDGQMSSEELSPRGTPHTSPRGAASSATASASSPRGVPPRKLSFTDPGAPSSKSETNKPLHSSARSAPIRPRRTPATNPPSTPSSSEKGDTTLSPPSHTVSSPPITPSASSNVRDEPAITLPQKRTHVRQLSSPGLLQKELASFKTSASTPVGTTAAAASPSFEGALSSLVGKSKTKTRSTPSSGELSHQAVTASYSTPQSPPQISTKQITKTKAKLKSTKSLKLSKNPTPPTSPTKTPKKDKDKDKDKAKDKDKGKGKEKEKEKAKEKDTRPTSTQTTPRNAKARTYIAAVSYTGSDGHELSFNKGEEILFKSSDENGWVLGQVGEDVGWFPGNCLVGFQGEGVSKEKKGPVEDSITQHKGTITRKLDNFLQVRPAKNQLFERNIVVDNGTASPRGNEKEKQAKVDMLNDFLHRKGSIGSSSDGAPSPSVSRPQTPPDTPKKEESPLEKGIQIFNSKPVSGIAFLIENGLIEDSTDSIVKFLLNNPKLDKGAIGDYLSDRDDAKASLALAAILKGMNFTGLDFDVGLRHFSNVIKLPGEAQKIERLLDAWTDSYIESNKDLDLFENKDAASVLAYAVVMLNVDAHSPKVLQKMPKQGFIHNLRKLNNGKDFNKDFLEELYTRIVDDEIKMATNTIFPYATKRDWLFLEVKQRLGKAKKRLWFVLCDGCLYYFRLPTDNVPAGTFSLVDVILTKDEDAAKGKFAFHLEVNPNSKRASFASASGQEVALHLSTISQFSLDSWMRCLERAIASIPPTPTVSLSPSPPPPTQTNQLIADRTVHAISGPTSITIPTHSTSAPPSLFGGLMRSGPLTARW